MMSSNRFTQTNTFRITTHLCTDNLDREKKIQWLKDSGSLIV